MRPWTGIPAECVETGPSFLQISEAVSYTHLGIPDFIYETFPILNEFRKRKGGDLSGGQQQQLAIARAVAAEPALLILDEPTEGIQPSVIQEIGRVITELKSRMAVLIVEQYLEFVMEIADYCYVMENGRIIMDGEPEELDQEKLQATMSL